jgi:two-component system, OmpR family, alkaline phosphatase synthesis response regulator PhoP
MSRIVVADDEANLAESTSDLLSACGHEVAVALGVPDIMPTLVRHRADLLLQDVRMPGMDLDAHLKALRSHPELQGLRIVLFTATVATDPLRQHPLIDSFLAKPFDLNGLLHSLDSALASPRFARPAP